jgi:predicted alpha/beta hydrolase family esterase
MVKDNLERKGYEVIGCKPNWEEGTHSDWLKDLFPEIGDKEIDLVIGHSYGAMLAFALAVHKPVKRLILCSLSPWFAEDLDSLTDEWKQATSVEMTQDLVKNFVFNEMFELVKNNSDDIYLLIGKDEPSQIYNRFNDAKKKLEAEGVVIEGVGHAFNERAYVDAVLNLLDTIE